MNMLINTTQLNSLLKDLDDTFDSSAPYIDDQQKFEDLVSRHRDIIESYRFTIRQYGKTHDESTMEECEITLKDDDHTNISPMTDEGDMCFWIVYSPQSCCRSDSGAFNDDAREEP
jgi:hypothetical protein